MGGDGQALTLAEIVARLGGEVLGDATRRVRQVATLESAAGDQIAFLANRRYRAQLGRTRAGAVVLARDAAKDFSGPCIVTETPYLYFARLARLLNPAGTAEAGVHPSARIDGTVPPSVSVGAYCVVEAGAVLGERVRLGAGCRIGAGAAVGDESTLYANVVVYPGCVIGRRAVVHAGVVIGSDGFGFAREADGSWLKIPQIGRAVIGDDVEIGANTTIDRGALDDTVIGDGVKIDNLVQVAHNVSIGERTIIAGCVGIAGSTRIGRRCMIGGAAMISGHLSIADDVSISGATFVGKSIARAGTYANPAPTMRHDDWLRNFAHLRRLAEMADRIRALERRLAELEGKT